MDEAQDIIKKVELPGAVNGRPGNYEWIISPNNEVNHRLFRPNKKGN